MDFSTTDGLKFAGVLFAAYGVLDKDWMWFAFGTMLIVAALIELIIDRIARR